MRIINNSIQARNIKNAVVTIGTFDGVHLGHQAIFKEMRRLADEVNGETVVVTFHPHPRQVLAIGTEKLRFICSQEEKLKKFEEFGIDNVVIIPFTKEFASTPSDEFIKNTSSSASIPPSSWSVMTITLAKTAWATSRCSTS